MSNRISLFFLVLCVTILNFSGLIETVQEQTHSATTNTILLGAHSEINSYDDNDSMRGPKRGAGRQDRLL